MRRRLRGDRGGITSNVIITPFALLLTFLVIQLSLLYYGESVATRAAQHGVDAARVETGTAAAGRQAIDQFIAQAGGINVNRIEVNRGATQVTATVEADPLVLIPGFPFHLRATITAPTEEVVN